ncbi:phage baseplate assembly protein [Bradyrhizobium japonicum]|uniref:phage baseplate assembly protein domain-containing protein n=1 Tax=Bradyrhizobium japonicum TaxID=375 RepID=UPI0027153670|nr:phage baseplate assembly protein [Bradyrhizobium japonicum]WLB66026.1 phage baseplate assembly protein [Bradyrhizobium japonicum]
MHRATPLNTSIRAYTAGGARSVVDKVDDEKLMQEMGGNFMANETRKEIEAPQNYGFTSVVFDAEKGQDGKVSASAETFIGFMGGNRSFPVSGPMDDRRHRLYKLQKGDTAMFRGRGDKQQFHMTEEGGYWTAPQNKTVRMQLAPEDSEDNSTQGGASAGGGAKAELRDGSAGGGGQAQGGQQKRGQEAVYKKGKDSHRFIDATKDASRVSGDNVHLMLGDKKVYVHVADDKNVYLGGKKGEGTFARVATEAGLSINVFAKIG